MPRDKPWFKTWTDWLGDAIMDRLSLAEQGAWWRLYGYAHECGHTDKKGKVDGALIVAGSPLSLAEIMKSLKITDELDKVIFNQMVDKMLNAGNLHWNGDALIVTKYENEQRATTDTKEARRQRQRDRREAMKSELEKISGGITSPPQDIEERDREQRERKEHHAQSSNENSVTQSQDDKNSHAKAVTIELSRCYEEYIGLLNPVDADRMREFIEYYVGHGGQVDWIGTAFRRAPINKRRWPYVQAILERYIEEGGPDDIPRPKQQGRPRPDAAGGRTTEFSFGYEWRDVGSEETSSPDEGDQG